jgi:hypothetical protein
MRKNSRIRELKVIKSRDQIGEWDEAGESELPRQKITSNTALQHASHTSSQRTVE